MCIKKWQKRSDGQHPQTNSFQERFHHQAWRHKEGSGCRLPKISRGHWSCSLTVNVNAITVRVVMLIAGLFARSLTRTDAGTAFLHTSLDGEEEVYVRPPPLLCLWCFTGKGLCLKKALCGLRSAPRLWGLTRDAVLAALVMCLKGREYALKQSCADLALWIIVWLGAETGLLFLDDQCQAIRGVAGYVLTHVDDMLAARDIPILHLFVDALKKEWEITQSKIIGPSKESEITFSRMWIAAMSGGGFGIHQCPHVSDVLKSWAIGECRRATTVEVMIPGNSKCPQLRFLSKSQYNHMFVWSRNVLAPCCGCPPGPDLI